MGEDLLKVFKEEISEQARKQGQQYSLPVVMYLSVIALLMGAKNPMEISKWLAANGKRPAVLRLLGVERIRLPRRSRLYEFFEIVDKAELEHAFRRWINSFALHDEYAVLAVDC